MAPRVMLQRRAALAAIGVEADIKPQAEFDDSVDDARSGIQVPYGDHLRGNHLIGVVHMQISTIGVDLAKHVFQVHGVDGQGKIVLVRQLRRQQMKGEQRTWLACILTGQPSF